MIGYKLKRQYGQNGIEWLWHGRHVQNFVGKGGHPVVPLGGDGNDVAFAGFDFLEVTEDFFVGAILDGDDDDRHVFVNKGNGAVFHFAGWVAFGVDVGDFFEFEGAFERDGIVVAPS
jgi:hypothetical protein